MKIQNEKEPVWYVKYQPQQIEDCILPKKLKEDLTISINSDSLPNLAFFSFIGGTGKSSTVNAILKDLDCEAIWINSSLDNGIDTIRGKIQNFASQQSFDNKRKVVVLDEVDALSTNAQMAFRGFTDEFSSECAFIFTGNYKDKIIPQLLQRFETHEFDTFSKAELIKPIFERLEFILNKENKAFKKEDLIQVISTFYPSVRAMIGSIQKYSVSGELIIPEGELDNLDKFENIMKILKDKKFNEMIEAVNNISAPDSFFGWSWKNIKKFFEKENLPKAVMILAKYQDMATRAVDKNLNLGACCTELMMQCQIK